MAESNRNISGFKIIENTGTVQIQFVPDTEFSVVLSGSEADLARTFTVLRGDTLVIYQDSNAGGTGSFSIFGMNISFGGNSIGPVTATIHAPELISFSNTGTGSLTCQGLLSVKDNLEIKCTGTGNITFDNLDCKGSLLMESTGTGNIRVSGKACHVKAKSTGIGSITGKLEYQTIERENIGIGRIDI